MAICDGRRQRGLRNHMAGRAAEDQVAARYERAGYPILARRLRTATGEIDLVLRDGAGYIFVEVKSAATHDAAGWLVGPGQVRRILDAAEEYLADSPQGSLTERRFDLALVDGRGRIEVIENAFWS
jgi:putative endonuclease